MNSLPLLATVDVEIARDRDLVAQEAVLWQLQTDLRGFPLTWFCTADAAEAFAAPLRALHADGHGIGCHGLDHGRWEDYRRLPPAQARLTLEQATCRIEAALGTRPRVFRGPRMTTSGTTQSTLHGLGYAADFSVCSRRLDFFAASAWDWHWALTNAAPYRPIPDRPFERTPAAAGSALPWVVPLSGFGLPLCSGTLYLLGEGFNRKLAAALLGPLRRQHAPLVYLFHSYEFVGVRAADDQRPAHHKLYPGDPQARYRRNRDFLTHLRDRLGALPMSAQTYLEELDDERAQRH